MIINWEEGFSAGGGCEITTADVCVFTVYSGSLLGPCVCSSLHVSTLQHFLSHPLLTSFTSFHTLCSLSLHSLSLLTSFRTVSTLLSISFLTLSSLPSLPCTHYVPLPCTFFPSWLPFSLSSHFLSLTFVISLYFLHFWPIYMDNTILQSNNPARIDPLHLCSESSIKTPLPCFSHRFINLRSTSRAISAPSFPAKILT